MTGISIAPDGTKICRTDTFNAYIWDERANAWRELMTRMTLPSGDVPHPRYWGEQSGGGRSDGPGCWEAICAPSDTNRIYAIWNAFCYKSTDRGRSFTKTSLPRIFARANDQNFAGGVERLMGPKMAVDPANPNVLWLSGDQGDGLWYSIDGGANWLQQSQVPVPLDGTGSTNGTGPYIIVFDPTSPVVDGRTQGIYVASYGRGLYYSRDAGSTFNPISGGPTTFLRMSCDQLGRVWLSDYRSPQQSIRKFENGLWTAHGIANMRVVDVAINPANPAHIIGVSSTMSFIQSRDNGATWQHWYGHTDQSLSLVHASAQDIPWLAESINRSSIASAAAVFDRTTGRCYIATGVGVFYFDQFPETTRARVELISQSIGIEQLCVWRIVAPPGGTPVTVQLDRSAMRLTDPNVPPTHYGPSLGLTDGFDLDYSLTDTSHMVALCVKAGNFSGFSRDRGETWTYFPGKDQMSASPGGSIAVSTPINIVHIPSNNGVARFTTDGGTTWRPLAIPGLPLVDGDQRGTGWGWSWVHNRKILCADKASPNVFYAYNYGPQDRPGLAGLWRTQDGGITWVRVKAGSIGEWTTFHAQLNSVPDREGHLFFTAGADQEQPFFRSTDGGASWTEVAGFRNVISFGFGKAASDRAYPTVFVSGWRSGNYGIWRSTDDCASWVKIGDYPLDSIDMSPSIAGDPNIYGRCYVAFGGSGAAYCDLL